MKKKLAVAFALVISLNMGLGQVVQNNFTESLGLTSKAEAFNLLSLFASSEKDLEKSYKEMIAYYLAGFELSSMAAQVSNELLNDYGVAAELMYVNGINTSTAGYDKAVGMVMEKGNNGLTVRMPEIDAERFFNMVPADDKRLVEAKQLIMMKDECFARGREVGTMLAVQSLIGGKDNKGLAMLIGSAIFLNEWKSSLDSHSTGSYKNFEKSLKSLNNVKVDKKKIKKVADGLRKG